MLQNIVTKKKIIEWILTVDGSFVDFCNKKKIIIAVKKIDFRKFFFINEQKLLTYSYDVLMFHMH